jgi:class 3 adenylate cyclase/tetratricopeptide (TPR) repeat protein
MPCPTCRAPIRHGAEYCARCGAALPPVCEGCGAALEATDRFCGACGRPVAANADSPGQAPAPPAEAEHRQITVAFCDLVGSTAHASKLDPEDWRDVVRQFQKTCIDVIQRFEGHVAQYLGDGLLVYFGYPHAHEDDAERAIRSALGVMATLTGLNQRLATEHSLELAARVGIHTGPVVVGDMGQSGRPEILAMGATANLAARLQAVALPGSVVISQETLQLVQGIFVTEDLGAKVLKGVSQPIGVHRVVQASGVRSRLALSRGRLTPFVGRDQEMGVLLDRWERVLDGEGQTVLVQGAAGIGKSRLILSLRERLLPDAHTWLECRGSLYTRGSPFHPMIELLEAGLAFTARDTPAEKRKRLERGIELAGFDKRDALPPIAALLDLPAEPAEEPARSTPRSIRDRTIETLTAWILALSVDQPVVLIVEDVHWFDPSSLDLLGALFARSGSSRVLALMTARPEFEMPWPAPVHATVVPIDSLRRRQARELVEGRARDGRLSQGAVERIVDRADGVPFYLEELTQAALEAEAVGAALTIPATLKDSLTARLDRLGAEKEVAQLASVIGREFPHRLLEAAAGVDPEALRGALDRLVASELLLRHERLPETSYVFRHALIQEAAYGALLRPKRRALHARVASALERGFPELAASQPELLARHFDEAGMPAEAIRCYQRAGERDTARSAPLEAIAHLSRGLQLVELRPQPEREREELALRMALGPSLIAARGPGDAEAGSTYQRARALCAPDAPELLHILPGIYTFHLNRGEMQAAFEVAQEQLAMASRAGDSAHLVRAHWSLGQTLCLRGDPVEATRELERAVALFDPARDRLLSHDRSDQGVSLRSWLSWASWLAGEPDSARRWGDEAVAIAREGAHPYSLAYSLGFDAVLHSMMRERSESILRAREAVAISQERGFPVYLALGKIVALWSEAPVSLEHDPEGRAVVDGFRKAFGALTGRGTLMGRPLVTAALAEILCDLGQRAEALETIQAGLAYGAETGIWFWHPELLRMQGDLALRAETKTERARGEALFTQAMELAREQRARSLELRAATSLARLWRERGELARARELLAPIFGAFRQGRGTPDLRAAAEILGDENRG